MWCSWGLGDLSLLEIQEIICGSREHWNELSAMDVGGKAFIHRWAAWAFFGVLIELERKIQKGEEGQSTVCTS